MDVFADIKDKPGIIQKRLTFFHEFPVLSVVDIQYYRPAFQRGDMKVVIDIHIRMLHVRIGQI